MKQNILFLQPAIILAVIDVILLGVIAFLVIKSKKAPQVKVSAPSPELKFTSYKDVEAKSLSMPTSVMTERKIGFLFLIMTLGMFFFANPMVALFDFLPDFLGCALIMYSLHRLSALTSDFEDAFKYFKFMVAISIGRTIIAFLSSQFDDVTRLSVSLVFAVAELIVAFFAFSAFSEGISVLEVQSGQNLKSPFELRNVSIIFFVARGFFSLLPYITSVLNNDDEFINNGGEVFEASLFTPFLTVINVILTTVFAVFFIITVIRNLGLFITKSEVKKILSDLVNEKRSVCPQFFVRKNLVFALTLLAYSPIFLIDFIAGLPVGGQSFIPDFIFGIFAVWAVILLRKQLLGFKLPMISGIVYTALSFVNFFVYNDFLSKHYLTDFSIIIKRFIGQYAVAVAFSFAETVALIVFAVAITNYLMPIATHYSVPDITEEFVRLRHLTTQSTLRTIRMMRAFEIGLIVAAILGTVLTATFQIFDVGYNDVDFPYLLIHIILHIVFYGLASTLFLRLRNGVYKRYEAF